jgi:hypothetical protein
VGGSGFGGQITNPGGDDSLDDAWVLTLRAQLDF